MKKTVLTTITVLAGLMNAQIIPVSYWEDSASLKINPFISALEEAINYNPKIINISGGGNSFYEREYLAIKKAESLGIIIVSAAGNDGKNIDEFENNFFPSAYRTSNIISVGAVTKEGSYFYISNCGQKSVDIAALGKDVTASGLDNTNVTRSGTSQATAIVCGAIAKAFLIKPDLTFLDIKQILLSSADRKKELKKYFKLILKINQIFSCNNQLIH